MGADAARTHLVRHLPLNARSDRSLAPVRLERCVRITNGIRLTKTLKYGVMQTSRSAKRVAGHLGSTMNMTKSFTGRFLLPLCLGIASVVSSADAQLVVIDDFELGEGHFNLAPDFSGTSQGMIKTAGPQDTTADQTGVTAFTGVSSQRLVVFDDIAVGGTPANVDSWRLRHLSGSGTPANNLSLAIVTGGTGFVGYWLKTSSAGLEAGLGIDDGAALEIARWQPIIADGEWHLYEWQFQNPDDWDAFAGTGPMVRSTRLR